MPLKLPVRIAIVAALVLVLGALFFFYERTPEEEYIGDLQGGLPHGFGIWKHSSGVYYAGNFFEGQWHGRGTWIHPDGIRYAGEWQMGEYHGRGTLIQPSGARYDGEWNLGNKHGAGIFRWPDGRRYTGYWADDRHEGYGILETPEGFNYRGKWLDGKRHGEGSAKYADGSEYYGQWLNDKRHGQGTYIAADGSIYNGGWYDDEKHGEGVFTYPDGTIKTGIWINGTLQEVPIESIAIDPPSLSLVAGGSPVTLELEIYPEDATTAEVIWDSSNPSVAAVDENGAVRPLRAGSATITATSLDGFHTAICTVTVSSSSVSVTGVRLSSSSLTLRVDETATLTATVIPSNATNRSVSWSSSNTAVATVYPEGSNRGGIRAFGVGEATITVTTSDGGRIATCRVTVLPKEDPVVKVIVPRLIGQQEETARSMITGAELGVGEVSYEYSATVPQGQVIRQNPAAGATVNRGSLVNIVVSRGPEPIPDPPPPDPDPDPDPDPNGNSNDNNGG